MYHFLHHYHHHYLRVNRCSHLGPNRCIGSLANWSHHRDMHHIRQEYRLHRHQNLLSHHCIHHDHDHFPSCLSIRWWMCIHPQHPICHHCHHRDPRRNLYNHLDQHHLYYLMPNHQPLLDHLDSCRIGLQFHHRQHHCSLQ